MQHQVRYLSLSLSYKIACDAAVAILAQVLYTQVQQGRTRSIVASIMNADLTLSLVTSLSRDQKGVPQTIPPAVAVQINNFIGSNDIKVGSELRAMMQQGCQKAFESSTTS